MSLLAGKYRDTPGAKVVGYQSPWQSEDCCRSIRILGVGHLPSLCRADFSPLTFERWQHSMSSDTRFASSLHSTTRCRDRMYPTLANQERRWQEHGCKLSEIDSFARHTAIGSELE